MPKEKIDSHASCRRLDLYKFLIHGHFCSSFLDPDLYKEYTKKRRNKQKHFNVTVANQFTVHRTSYCKENFFQQKWKGEKHRTSAVFYPPNISPLSKNMGGLVVQRRKANFRGATLTIMQNNFGKIECIWFQWADSTYSQRSKYLEAVSTIAPNPSVGSPRPG